MSDPDYGFWSRLPVFTLSDAASLCCEVEPHGYPWSRREEVMLGRLIRELGIPKKRWGGNEHDEITRERLIRWAEQTGERPGFLFPNELSAPSGPIVTNKTSPDYAFWSRQPDYSLEDAAALYCDIEPGSGAEPFKVNAAFVRLLMDLGIEKSQNSLRANPQPRVTRERLIRWAEQTGERPGFLFPDRVQSAVTRAGTTRDDRLNVAIRAALKSLRDRLGREPKADEVFRYLEDEPTGVVVDSTDDALTWESENGALHDTKRKTLANRISRLRKLD